MSALRDAFEKVGVKVEKKRIVRREDSRDPYEIFAEMKEKKRGFLVHLIHAFTAGRAGPAKGYKLEDLHQCCICGHHLVDKKLAADLATQYIADFIKTLEGFTQDKVVEMLQAEQAKITNHESSLAKVFGGRREGLTTPMSEAEMCIPCHQAFCQWMKFEMIADRHGPVVHALSKIANTEGIAIT